MDIVERLRRMSDMTTTGNDLGDIAKAADEIERLRKLLDACRESMRVSQRFHPNVTDWRGVIAAIDHEIGAKELQTP